MLQLSSLLPARKVLFSALDADATISYAQIKNRSFVNQQFSV